MESYGWMAYQSSMRNRWRERVGIRSYIIISLADLKCLSEKDSRKNRCRLARGWQGWQVKSCRPAAMAASSGYYDLVESATDRAPRENDLSHARIEANPNLCDQRFIRPRKSSSVHVVPSAYTASLPCECEFLSPNSDN